MKKIAFFTTGYYPVHNENVKAIESLTYLLATTFAKRGYEIHIFGSKESKGNFKVHVLNVNKEIMKKSSDGSYYYLNLAENFCDTMDYCAQNNIDVIFDQTNSISYTLSRYSKVPVISTLHGPRTVSDLSGYYQQSKFSYIISPSEYVKKISPDINVREVIPHGIDINHFQYNACGGNDFVTIGRIIPDKGQLDAIKVANDVKTNIALAGYHPEYIDDDSYFKEVVNRAKKSKYCKFVGRVERTDVPKFMGNAKALLMPIKWHEPFGLVIIESMATGTPVISYNMGSASELIIDRVTGFIVPPNDTKAMGKAAEQINQMSQEEYQKMRQACRRHVEENFTVEKMVDQYEKVYQKVT